MFKKKSRNFKYVISFYLRFPKDKPSRVWKEDLFSPTQKHACKYIIFI